MNATIHIHNTEDAVGIIAAYVTRVLADTAPGHDRETVGRRMTTDKALDTIRTAYQHRINVIGDTPKDAVIAVGVRLIQQYRITYGL